MPQYEIDEVDYIRAFMTERAVDVARAALVVVDMQHATGHREGALGRRMIREGSNVTNYRFDRIENKVVPNTKRLLSAFRKHGAEVLYLTVGSARRDIADAPPHMAKLFRDLDNYEGSREHEIIGIASHRTACIWRSNRGWRGTQSHSTPTVKSCSSER